MSANKTLPQRLALSAAITTALFSGYGGRKAYAACVVSPVGTYTCSGAETTTQTINTINPSAITITTSPGFSLNTAAGDGFDIDTGAATLGLTFTDNNSSTITGANYGIDALNSGTGALSSTTTGAVTGTSQYGIRARNTATGTDLTINTASVTGGNGGILAANFGTGALSITSSGAVTGTNYYGIYTRNEGTDLTINATTLDGGFSGIRGHNLGSGALSITTTGAVTGTNYNGIYVTNNGTNLTIDAASATGGYYGIKARNSGTGALSVTSSGTVSGGNYAGIRATNTTSGNGVTINATGNVSGGDYGIIGWAYGSGDLTITTSGSVTGTDIAGIYSYKKNTGDISITASGAITGGNRAGIYNWHNGVGQTRIVLNSGASVSATSGVAIFDYGPGSTTVTVNSGASVAGKIVLGPGNDTLAFDGGDFSQVTLFDGDDFDIDAGAGGNFDSLTLSGSGTLNTDLLVNWEEINIGGSVAFSNNAFTFSQLTIASGGVLNTGTAFTFTGNLILAPGGTLDSTGNSPGNTIIAGNLTNNGTITMFDGEANDSVTVTGNYTGAGALLIDTVLNDGVVDITDRLVINGSSAGTTAVTVNNVGGAGGDTDTGNPTTDGIQIVQVDGASAGIFTLAGPVTAGAFTYDLVQADGQNWFLQSTGLIDQLFGYSALASAIHDQLEPLRQRDHRNQLVTLDGDISTTGNGFWSRVSYSETEADASNSVGSVKVDSELEYERSKLQIGYDQTLRSDSLGTLIAGVFGQYQDLELQSDDSLTGARQANADAEGWGVGASLTYYAASGWYGDAMVQATDYDIDVDGASGSKASTDALNWSVSMEGGYAFALSDNLTITPQAQLLWQQTDFDKLTDSTGVTAKWAQRDSLTARAGVTLERDFMVGQSPITGYVVTDVVQVMTDASEVEVNGVNVKTQLNRTRLDLRVGGQHISADKQLVLYAELGVSEALNSKDYQRIDATAGVRWKF